jgi:hypothetical protein
VSTRLRVAAAAVCLVFGTLTLLLATDVLRWQESMKSGDTRFEAGSSRSSLWSVPHVFTFGVGKSVAGVNDDLAYRTALREFARGLPRSERASDTEIISQRGKAQEELAAIASGTQDPRLRAAASNLVGVLGFANAAIDPSQAPTYLTDSIARFREAIALDPNNADAKHNLELALARIGPAKRASGQSKPRTTRGGTGSGAGSGEPGSGY